MTDVYDHRQLDVVLQARLRLAAMTLLAVTGAATFAALKERLGASDGNLGAHMKKLRDAGYVAEDKRFENDKPLTTYRITAKGRRALETYLDRLAAMVKGRT
ncbi:MAG: transcriptional regulator [Gemmatimonadaceae bacterium]|jgi:DNA-binding transcriptional ArsR family regulator|nr:transcriptional regulator [Gemmatimonadaceae bacterium]